MIEVSWLGKRDYSYTWEMQKALHRLVCEYEGKEKLLLVEHNPVITLGRRAKETNILLPEAELKRKGVEVYRIERGGDVTFHGPGQLVGYPILNLKKRGLSIHSYITSLEESLINLLRKYEINGFRKEKMIGVWTEEGKIAAIGVAVKNWVTFHGFALNVITALSYFNLIVPCGINEPVTSMEMFMATKPNLDEVAEKYSESFNEIFG